MKYGNKMLIAYCHPPSHTPLGAPPTNEGVIRYSIPPLNFEDPQDTKSFKQLNDVFYHPKCFLD